MGLLVRSNFTAANILAEMIRRRFLLVICHVDVLARVDMETRQVQGQPTVAAAYNKQDFANLRESVRYEFFLSYYLHSNVFSHRKHFEFRVSEFACVAAMMALWLSTMTNTSCGKRMAIASFTS